MTTVTYLSSASNETYSGGAFNYISARIDGINDAANALGISAGAMAEENTAYGFLDTVLDKYAQSGIDPATAAATFIPASAAGIPGLAAWEAANLGQLTTRRTHAQWQAYYDAAKAFDGKPSLLDKLLNPALVDAGPANFKIVTAIDLVINYADKYPALGLSSYKDDYSLLVEDLMKEVSFTAKLYGLYMKEKAEVFFKNSNAYGGQWESLPQVFRDALLVTYTNIGEAGMEKLKNDNYLSKGLPYEPQPALSTGGGMNHLFNASSIGDRIGLVGYGAEVGNAVDFAVLAQANTNEAISYRYPCASPY